MNAMIIEQKSLDASLDSEKDYDNDNNIYHFILSALLGGRSIYEKIKLNDVEQIISNLYLQELPKTNNYTYLGVPFSNDLELKPIIQRIHFIP